MNRIIRQQQDILMKHIYTFLCLFLFSGVVYAGSAGDATLFDDPARLLLTFAEISIALTAFSGIAVVIGRRGGGQWTELDVLRFTAIIINGLLATFISVLPFLVIDTNVSLLQVDWNTVLLWAGCVGIFEVYWRAKAAWTAIKKRLDEDTYWISVGVFATSVLVYGALFSVVFNVFQWPEFKVLLYLVVWHIFSACFFFLRMIRHSGVDVSTK